MIPIQASEVITLSLINFVTIFGISALVWFFFPKSSKLLTLGILASIYLWSVVALLDYFLEDRSFFSWFLDPSAEKNLIAMVSSSLLIGIAVVASYLFWKALSSNPILPKFYWFLVAFLFLFLMVDEYFSIHESIRFWRTGYLALGGAVGIIGILFALSLEKEKRNIIFFFLFGLGVMGGSGVFMDAFSAGHVVDLGPIHLSALQCRKAVLGVSCFNYNNTEELLELAGAALMLLSLLAVAKLSFAPKLLGRIVLVTSSTWFILVMFSLLIAPSIVVYISQQVEADYGEISLLAYQISSEEIQAGETLELEVYTRLTQATDIDYSLSVHLLTQALPDVTSIAQDDKQLGEFLFPSHAWIPYLAVRTHYSLQIPTDLESNNSYQLVAILWHSDDINNVIPVQISSLRTLDEGRMLILDGLASPATATNPISQMASFQFDTGIELSAYQLPENITVGSTAAFEFWWRNSKKQDLEMSQFLHFFNTETSEYLVFNQSPFQGRFPTNDWLVNMFVMDTWHLEIPQDTPIGDYRIEMGLVRIDNQDRIPVTDEAGNPVQDNSIILGTVYFGN